MSDDDFAAVIDANLTGSYRIAKRVVREMMKARWGRLVFVSSVVGFSGQTGQANYAASKAGLLGLARTLAREFASRDITSNMVVPGPIDTAMLDDGRRRHARGHRRRRSRSAAAARPTRSPPPSSSSAPTTPRSSPARSCRSTAAWRWGCERRSVAAHAAWSTTDRAREWAADLVDFAGSTRGPMTGNHAGTNRKQEIAQT